MSFDQPQEPQVPYQDSQVPHLGKQPPRALVSVENRWAGMGTLVALGVVAVAAVGGIGWWVIGSFIDVPWYVAVPLSLVAGSAFIGWQFASTWRGYAVTGLIALVGFLWFAWWWVEHAL